MSSLPEALNRVFSQASPALVPELISGSEMLGPNLVTALLSDSQGAVQAIYPNGCLLDVDSLNKKLGRELKGLSLTEQTRLSAGMHMVSIPAVPLIAGFEIVLDRGILLCDPVYLDSGQPGLLLRLPLAQYYRLFAQARRLDCAVPLDQIEVNFGEAEHDQRQIGRAVQRFTSLRIQQRLEDTLELPPLSATAKRIIRLRVNPNAEVGELADVVENDPSLAAQVVSWANSAFYATPGRVQSIYDAVMRVLGFELVMNLAMGLSLGRTLTQPDDLPDGWADYWQQAIWIAQASGVITGLMRRGRRPVFGLAYLAGLLHNFGYLVLAHVFPPHLALICRYAEANRQVDTAYVEHHLLGITREQIAAQLMGQWGMPEEVVIALRYQKHAAYRGPHSEYPLVLSLARQCLLARDVPLGAPGAVSSELIAELGVNPAELEQAMDELVLKRSDIHAMAVMMRAG